MVTVDNFETHHFNNELYEIQNNRWDWEKRYLHVNYSQNLDTNLNVTMVGIFAFVFCSIEMFKDFLYTIFFFFQPCPDVFWFPMVTERFCDELVGEMENFGQWSDGTNTVSKQGFVNHKLLA